MITAAEMTDFALAQLREVVKERRSLDATERQAVATLRANDVSWSRIGKALGTSAQAAQQRFGKP